MAVLVTLDSHDAFVAELRKLDHANLIAQQCTQQGAIHALAWLLMNGCTAETAGMQIASLRRMSQLIRTEFVRRGLEDPYPQDQTGFS